MQIVIPMSGQGERFRKAGYAVPKPLIEIEGKPIIAHVIDLFPDETDFIFICNKYHLQEPSYKMEETILRYCPTAIIIGIDQHNKGPVHTVLQAADKINPSQPVTVNYCDFACCWNWKQFKDFVKTSKCDGAIPAYKGFHPHSIKNFNYAYMREENGSLLDIQEKQPFTENHNDEYASSGTYYFASGKAMLEAFHKAIECNLNVNGEHYVSLAYKPMLDKGDKIKIYEIQHFMQWGTPEDLTEYLYWSNAFKKLIDNKYARQSQLGGTVIVPMAGLGARFSKDGYTTAKPMIPVSGLPMVIQATRDLPKADNYVFILRKIMLSYREIADELKANFPSIQILILDSVTEGQACTASLGLAAAQKDSLTKKVPEPITFGACDNGALYDIDDFSALINDPTTDVIVWGVRGYANAALNPKMYGWIEAEQGNIKSISVKVPLNNPANDPIVLGTFTFRRAEDFNKCVRRMLDREGRVNGEYYIDACINDALALGMRCRLFEVDSFLCWGTPNDLRCFEYWQSCFHKWEGHPYSIFKDSRVPNQNAQALTERYQEKLPDLRGKLQ